MNNSSSTSEQPLSRLEKERARKRAKRASESPLEKERRRHTNRAWALLCRASESEAERSQCLAAGQQREAARG